MPYEETLSGSQEGRVELRPLTKRVEKSDIEFGSHGGQTGQPEIYQIKAWGQYQGEIRLRDYSGIAVSNNEFFDQLPYPLSEPDI